MGEKAGHHRTGSFPANMGPAAYNTALFFKKLRALDFCRPTPMPMTDVEAFPRTQHIIFNSKCVLTYGRFISALSINVLASWPACFKSFLCKQETN